MFSILYPTTVANVALVPFYYKIEQNPHLFRYFDN